MADLKIDDKVETVEIGVKVRKDTGAGIGYEPDLDNTELGELVKDCKLQHYYYKNGKCYFTGRLDKDKELKETNKIKKVKDVEKAIDDKIKETEKKLKDFKESEVLTNAVEQ